MENFNIKISVLDYVTYKQLKCHVRRMNEERLPQNLLRWCTAHLEEEEEKKTMKFADAGSKNWNEL